jgi:hypothetical protein
MHVWLIEVRDLDTSRRGGWTPWHPLWSHLHRTSYETREAVEQGMADLLDSCPPSTQYRPMRYDRRGK